MEIENWKNTGNQLIREFVFKDQSELANFIVMIANYSDEVNHHADMQIRECRKLRVQISTHDKNQLTELDFHWAQGLNERIRDREEKA